MVIKKPFKLTRARAGASFKSSLQESVPTARPNTTKSSLRKKFEGRSQEAELIEALPDSALGRRSPSETGVSQSAIVERHPRSGRVWIAALGPSVVVSAAALIVVAPAEAQTVSGARPARLEVAATVSRTQPRVAVVNCCELRTREQYSTTDRTFASLAAGVQVRLLRGTRASTSVDIAWAPPARLDFSVPAPSSIPGPIAPGFLSTAVVGRSTERRGWTLSAGQGIDLLVRHRWRASVAADIVLDRTEERYEQTSLVYADPQTVGIYSSRRIETLAAAAATAGLKFYLTPRVFVTADANVRRYFRHASLDRPRSSIRVGLGFGLGPK
jgi:hypothetical protein